MSIHSTFSKILSLLAVRKPLALSLGLLIGQKWCNLPGDVDRKIFASNS